MHHHAFLRAVPRTWEGFTQIHVKTSYCPTNFCCDACRTQPWA